MELEQLAEELNNLKSGIEQDKYNNAKSGWYAGPGASLNDSTAIGDVLFDALYNNNDMSAESTLQIADKLLGDCNTLSSALTKTVNTLRPALEKIKEQAESLKETVEAQQGSVDASDKVAKAEEAASAAADSAKEIVDDTSPGMPQEMPADMAAGGMPEGDAMAGPAQEMPP